MKYIGTDPNESYSKEDLDNGQLDNRYYTETEVDTALAGKADSTHNHAFTEITGTATAAQIPDLDASKITTGTFNETQIPTASSSIKGGARIYKSGTTGYIYLSN